MKERIQAAPASGFRVHSSGTATYVGSTGNYWTASPGGSGSAGAGYLYFFTSYINPLDGYGRASGSAVRCVQE